MPIYQYECSDCGDVFEHLWRSFAEAGNEHAACPQCGSTTTRTLFPGTAIGPRRLTVPRSKEPGEHKEVVVPESVPEDERPLPSTPGAWQVLEPEDMGDPSSHEAMQAISGAPGWFLVGASLRGRQHAHEGRYREDAFVIACHNGWNIAAVADGAGSASLARVGARVATQACVDSLARNLEGPEEMELSDTPSLALEASSSWPSRKLRTHSCGKRRSDKCHCGN